MIPVCLLTGVLLLSSAFYRPAQSLQSFLDAAGELEKRAEYADAGKIYLRALVAFPNEPELLKRLGIVYQTELKFQDSIEVFLRVLQRAPQYPEINFYLGLSHLGLNQFERALEAFSAELKLNPKYRRAHYYAALALQSLDRRVEASQHLETLIKEDPKDTKVWYQLARLHRSMALQAFKQVAVLEPDSAALQALKAESYGDDERYADAIREYQEVLRKDPNFPGARFGLAEAYYRSMNVEAEKELRLVLQENPAHPEANYYLAEILLRSQKAQEALPLLQLAVAGDSKLTLAHFQLGKCYLALGDLEKAVAALTQAVELDPNAKETHYQLAQAYGRLKDDEKRKHHLAIFEQLTQEEKNRALKNAEKALQKQK